MLQEIIEFYIERFDFLLPLIIEHLQLSAFAITFASVIGVSTGIFISEKRKLSPLILAIISFVYTIPSISMLGFLIPLSGIGNTSAIIALSIYALLPIIRSTYTGLTSVDEDLIEAARGMGSTNLQILYKIKLPLALPIILSGFRNMVVMTIALAGIASFIGAGGLGVAIYRGITTNNMIMTIAGSATVAIVALCSDILLGLLEHYITKRHHKKNRKRPILMLVLCMFVAITVTVCASNPKQDQLHIATKPMSESLVLGELLKQMIEAHTDIDVKLTKGVGGGTSNIHPAMLKGDFDLYPEYTGTAWKFILKNTTMPQQDTLYKQLKKEYKTSYGLVWTGLYGFNNTYGIAITKQMANQYHIQTYSDLASISSTLTFGAEYDFFERDDGFDAMTQQYNFQFDDTVDLEIGLKYQALQRGEVDAIIAYRTDGELNDEQYVLLEDDAEFFTKYYAGSVIRQDTLHTYPEVLPVLKMLDNQISDKEMSNMNYKVNTLNMSEQDVAHEFLVKKHLLEE